MKSSLEKLSAIIAVTFFCIAAKAQIVYTDVKPDKTFKDSGAVYHLDLNNDGTNDFDIRDSSHKVNFSGHCNGQHTNYYINIIAQQNNAVLTNDNYYPSPLNLNNIIQANSSYWSNTNIRPLEDAWWICQAPQPGCTFCIWQLKAEHDGNNWANGTDIYLGLKLVKGSNTYYGWIRLSLYFYVSLSNQDSVSFTIKDYAFNSKPNMPVLTGQKTSYNWIAVTALSNTNSSYPFQYCPKDKLSVTYLKPGTFNSGNVFTVQLSDSTGSFSHPKAIGSIHSTIDTVITATIPANTSPGGKYRIRIASSNPVTDSLYDNGTDLIIGAGLTVSGPTEFCYGSNSQTFLYAPAGFSYKWHKNGKLIQSQNTAQLQIDPSGTDDPGIYTYKCIVAGICGSDTSNAITITVHSLPKAGIVASGPTTFCKGGNVTLTDTSTGSGLQYLWLRSYQDSSGNQIYDTIPDATHSYTATQTGDYHVMMINKYGCTSYSNDISVSVPDVPKAYIDINTEDKDSGFCNGDSIPLDIIVTYGAGSSYVPFQYQWIKNGKNLPGGTLSYLYAKTAGIYTCKVLNLCGSVITKGVTLTTKPCNGLANTNTINNVKTDLQASLSIAPNPFSNSTTISFTVSHSQKVLLSIYDMNGRLIKTLADAQMQQGTYQFIWNARDEKGSAVVSGIYLLKMNAGNYSETKKISIIR